MEDRIANNALVIAAVGRACALPRDMEKLRKFDDVTLALSSMQSAISVSLPQFNQVYDLGYFLLMPDLFAVGAKMPSRA